MGESVALGVVVGGGDIVGNEKENRYAAIAARWPRMGRYAYGYSGAAWNRMYEAFQDMLDKDPHLASVFETRRKAVTGLRWDVLPDPNDGERGVRAAALVKDALRHCENFEGALRGLLGAIGFGWSVSEVVWSRREDGYLGFERIVSRWPGRFVYDADGALCLKSSRWDAKGRPLPERKFVTAKFGDEHDNPYGAGLLIKAFWFWWFKKNALRFWNLFNEKYGAPLAVAKHPAGASEEVRERLREVLEALQSDSGVVLEEGQAIEFVQAAASRMGVVNHYRELAEFCNDELTKLFLGATLAVSAGKGGSLALARVHESVRQDYVEDDARMLMGVVNGQLARWLVDVNFGADAPAPRFVIETEPQADLKELGERIEAAVKMGLRVPVDWIHAQLGVPAAGEQERSLRYDDQNLYQYHLQWGVLTTNEVRRSMGLAPLPYGDAPANPLVTRQLAEMGLLRLPEGKGALELGASQLYSLRPSALHGSAPRHEHEPEREEPLKAREE
ncbi:DUF935 family protein [Candidatus Sumerlaeota bacterium]|nr:DUF935 family protein [Candidatus Sumerlaeota bacterium]